MADPIFFRVVTAGLFVRPLPSRNTTPVGRLIQNQQIEVIPDSRTEAEGNVWWQHALGWSAERSLNPAEKPLMERVIVEQQGRSDAPVNLNNADQITLPTGTRIDRPMLFSRHPVALIDTQWTQYFGNTRFAFNLQFDRNPRRQRMYFYSQGLHAGIDYGNNDNKTTVPIVAGITGRVEKVARNATVYRPGFVWVRAGDFVVIYGHMGNIPSDITVGSTVTPGTKLGFIEPLEDHLHLEIRYRQTWIINPLVFMTPAMTDAFMVRFPVFNFYSSPVWTRWLTPFDQPVLRLGSPDTNPLIGPRSIQG